MTVSDPARDGRTPSDASAENRRAVAANPDAFDLRRVSLKTGGGMLCVSATFAGDIPSGRRSIGLTLTTATPQLESDIPLAQLHYGINENVANWAPFGAVQSEPISGQTTRGVRERVVELAVPINQLVPLTQRPDSALRRRAFNWRIGTVSDCVPGPGRLIGYPASRLRGLPGGPTDAINAFAPGGCRVLAGSGG